MKDNRSDSAQNREKVLSRIKNEDFIKLEKTVNQSKKRIQAHLYAKHIDKYKCSLYADEQCTNKVCDVSTSFTKGKDAVYLLIGNWVHYCSYLVGIVYIKWIF